MGLLDYLWKNKTNEATIDGVRFQINYDDLTSKISIDLLSLPSVALALEIKSNDIAQIPFSVFTKTNGGRERLRSGLDYRLSQQPNAYQNAYQFWKTVAMQMHIAECFVSLRGEELNILPFGLTMKYQNASGETRYAVLYSDEEREKLGIAKDDIGIKDDFAYGEVLHFYSSQDEYGNVLPLRNRFAATLGLGSDIESYACNIYNRGGVIPGYLTTDQKVPQDVKQAVIDGFKTLFGKPNSEPSTQQNTMKIAALDYGWKFNFLNLTPQEMQLLETRKEFTKDVARMFNLPFWKMGLTEDYHYSSSETADRDYLRQSLNPTLCQIERELNTKLVAEFERELVYIEANRDKIISIDAKTMAEIDDIAIKNGSMSVDEWRARRNQTAVAGGDLRQIQSGVASATYVQQAEALKIEALALQNELLRQQIEAAKPKPPEPPATAPEPITDAPGPKADSEADPALSDALNSLQSRLAETASGRLGEAESLRSVLAEIVAEVAKLHSVSTESLRSVAEKYAEDAVERIARSEAGYEAYEINRAINAANYWCIRNKYGTSAKVAWKGGAFDGQIKGVDEKWGDKNYSHPPLNREDVNSFLIFSK